MIAFIIFCVIAIVAIALCIYSYVYENDALEGLAILFGSIAFLFCIISLAYYINYSSRDIVAKEFAYMVNIYNDKLEHSDCISLTDIEKINKLNKEILDNRKPKNGWFYRNEAIANTELIDFYGKNLKKEVQ